METVLHSSAYCLEFLRDQVAGLSAAELVVQPPGVRNHPAWVIGHLTVITEKIGGVVGLEPWLPADWDARFGFGSAPVADPAAHPAPEEALAALRDAQERLTRAVRAVPDAALDAPFPDPDYLNVFPTVRHALTQVLVGHTSYHVGQVGVWRTARGLPSIGRSFE